MHLHLQNQPIQHFQSSLSPLIKCFESQTINSSTETLISIDKNLTLKLTINTKKRTYKFQGIILYKNRLPLKIAPKSWELISYYHSLQSNVVIFLYDFESETIRITSKLCYTASQQSKTPLIKNYTDLIFQKVKSLVSTLYRYSLISLSGKFFLRQRFNEAKLKAELIHTLYHSKKSDISKKNKNLISIQIRNSRKDLQKPNSNIIQCQIQKCIIPQSSKSQKILPQSLLTGAKNMKHHIKSLHNGSFIQGGFFQIQKIFVQIKKKLQNSNQSILNSAKQSLGYEKQPIQTKEQKFQIRKDLLVCKTLKWDKYQCKHNRFKISKELLILQQIDNKRHLLNYYKSKSPLHNLSKFSNQKYLLQNRNSVEQSFVEENFQPQTQIYMDFQLHTLKDIIQKQFKSREQQMHLCLELLEAITDLHQSNVIHRDLKPQNILVNFNSSKTKQILKIIDFSESAIFYDPKNGKQKQSLCRAAAQKIFFEFNPKFYGATLPYSPPECQFNRQKRIDIGINSFKIDSWSLGMILSEILKKRRLVNFPKHYAGDIINAVKSSGFQIYDGRTKKRGFDIFETLTIFVAIKSISINQAVRFDISNVQKAFIRLSRQHKKWTAAMRGQKEQPEKNPESTTASKCERFSSMKSQQFKYKS